MLSRSRYQERAGRVIDDIVRLEKRIFPKHESLARSFHDELKRRNSGLIYSTLSAGDGDEEVVWYAMYTCATSICASITTKLAVKESCRRQGHGEAPLKAAVERCQRSRVQPVSLHVDPARTAAVALHQKVGFQVDAAVRATTLHKGMLNECTWIFRNHQELSKKSLFIVRGWGSLPIVTLFSSI